MGVADQSVTLTEIRAKDGVASFGLVIPPAVAGLNRPTKIYAVAAPDRPGEGVSPSDFLTAAGNFAAGMEVSGDPSQAQSFTVDVPGVPNGVYFGQVILEFAE
jgi:hypothetical protein